MTNRAEPSAPPLPAGILWRARQAGVRALRGFGARLWMSLWQIVIVAVIMVSLAALGDLSLGLALTAFVSFAAFVTLLPRQELGSVSEDQLGHSVSLVRSKSAMHVLAEALPDPVILLSRDGQVLFYNRPAEDLFPSLRDGVHISLVIRTPEFLDAVSSAPKRGRAVTVNYAQRVPVGRRMAVTVAPLARSSEHDGNILVFLRDLTEGERINQMRADFITNASHELRTPLASLRGFIETLQGTAKDDRGARERFLPIMAEQASRMTRLIEELLSLSRVEMNAHVAPSDLVDLNDILGQAGDTLEPLADDAGISMEIARFPGPAMVLGERDELLQVLQNLVQNALKYGNPDGQVRVEAKHIPSLGRQGSGRYAISVVDDGPGIPPEHLPRLTERFYRVDVASSREKGGTGLGLAIVKHILNRHRGELTISSEPGKGSTFTVMLNEACAN